METDRLKQAVRQWGVRALCLRMTGTLDEETALRLALHSAQLAQEMGLDGSTPAGKAAAIKAAFNEPEPATGQQIVNAMAAAKMGDADAVAFLTRCGMTAP